MKRENRLTIRDQYGHAWCNVPVSVRRCQYTGGCTACKQLERIVYKVYHSMELMEMAGETLDFLINLKSIDRDALAPVIESVAKYEDVDGSEVELT